METADRKTTYKSDVKMNMNLVRSNLKPWTDKEGNDRYYVNDLGYLLSKYRSATDSNLKSYYDWGEMRASGGRVREIIEGNILPKTKMFIDSEGYVNIYGYAIAGMGEAMGLPELLVKVARYFYGYCDEETREGHKDLIGKSGSNSRIGDTVRITKGRKEVGKVFEVFKISTFSYSRYADPSVYLYAEDGFKVSANNCTIEDVGYSY